MAGIVGAIVGGGSSLAGEDGSSLVGGDGSVAASPRIASVGGTEELSTSGVGVRRCDLHNRWQCIDTDAS